MIPDLTLSFCLLEFTTGIKARQKSYTSVGCIVSIAISSGLISNNLLATFCATTKPIDKRFCWTLLKCVCLSWRAAVALLALLFLFSYNRQSMNEIDVSDFRYGGVNITGFTLIDNSLPRFQAFLKELRQFDPGTWLDPLVRRNITVGSSRVGACTNICMCVCRFNANCSTVVSTNAEAYISYWFDELLHSHVTNLASLASCRLQCGVFSVLHIARWTQIPSTVHAVSMASRRVV